MGGAALLLYKRNVHSRGRSAGVLYRHVRIISTAGPGEFVQRARRETGSNSKSCMAKLDE
jgi:hypothetical protein